MQDQTLDGPRRIAGVLAAMVGAMIVIRPGAGVFTWWALLPLCCALSYATSALLTRKIGAQESVWASMVYAALFGTIVAGLALPFVWEPVATGDLWKFVLIACLGTGAQLCIIRSFSITEASIVAPFIYTGIQIVSHRLLRDAPEGPFSTNILWNRAMEEGRLYGLSFTGLWFEVGTPQAIRPTEEALLGG